MRQNSDFVAFGLSQNYDSRTFFEWATTENGEKGGKFL